MPSFVAAIALAVNLLVSPAQNAPGGPGTARVDTTTSTPATAAQATAPPDSQADTGLPVRAPDPRTLSGYWPVFAVFAAAWIVIVGYLLTLGRRSRRIAREVYGAPADPRSPPGPP